MPNCPVGWTPYLAADGRTIVSGNPGDTIGSALSNGEDRVHSHVMTATFQDSSVSLAGISGCCNSLATADGVTLAGTAKPASSGIPYVQLTVCQKTGKPWPGGIPSGSSVFTSDGCQDGSSEITTDSGRLVVGLPQNSVNGKQFGSVNPSHSHGFSGVANVDTGGVALLSGCCTGGYASPTVNYSGTSNGSDARFPSIVLRSCNLDAVSGADVFPTGIVLPFSTDSCPSGWQEALYYGGRVAVGTSNNTQVSVSVGQPLGDQEDRTHTHDFDATVTLGQKPIAAAAGGNHAAAQSGTYTVKRTTAAATSGNGLVQRRMCERM